jgi:hypothetical protein
MPEGCLTEVRIALPPLLPQTQLTLRTTTMGAIIIVFHSSQDASQPAYPVKASVLVNSHSDLNPQMTSINGRGLSLSEYRPLYRYGLSVFGLRDAKRGTKKLDDNIARRTLNAVNCDRTSEKKNQGQQI